MRLCLPLTSSSLGHLRELWESLSFGSPSTPRDHPPLLNSFCGSVETRLRLFYSKLLGFTVNQNCVCVCGFLVLVWFCKGELCIFNIISLYTWEPAIYIFFLFWTKRRKKARQRIKRRSSITSWCKKIKGKEKKKKKKIRKKKFHVSKDLYFLSSKKFYKSIKKNQGNKK